MRRYHVCSTASLRNRSARPHRPQPATSLSPALNCRGSSSGRCPRFDPAVEPATPEAVVHHIDSEQTLTAPIQQLQRARDRSAVARFFPVAEPQMSGLCFPTRSTSGCPRAGSKVASSISAVDNGLPMRSHRCAAIFSCPSPPALSPAPATCTGENACHFAATFSAPTCPRAGPTLPSPISRVAKGPPARLRGCAADFSHAARAALALRPPPGRGLAREIASPLCGHFLGTYVPAGRSHAAQPHLPGGEWPPGAIARLRGRSEPC